MKFVDMTWQDTARAAAGATALLPLGATEQHGPHLAVSTDTAIVTAIAEHVERLLPESLVLCPTVPFGSSHHHLAFGGTLSLRPAFYTSTIVDLVQSLLSGGFRRIVLLNGHGGNITPVRQALAEVSQGSTPEPPWIVLATYWELAGDAFAGAQPMESPALSHACEYETSLMLHLYPERVRTEEIRRAKRPADTAYIRWEDDTSYRGVSVVTRTEFLSSNGSSGEPQLANSSKGQHLFNHAVSALTSFLLDFKTWPELRDHRRL
jgi:creatinine amidohydrolase